VFGGIVAVLVLGKVCCVVVVCCAKCDVLRVRWVEVEIDVLERE
jgi:hypothetical protein